MENIKRDTCAYCKKSEPEIRIKFFCLDGSICNNCSSQWHKDNFKATPEKDADIMSNFLSKCFPL